MPISEPLRLTTASKISTDACESARLGLAEIVVETPDSSLAELVIVSPAVKVPVGTVMVIVAELGFVITCAVVPLDDPVMVRPTTRFVEAPTVAVITPIGYVATEELEEYRARV